MDNSEVSLLAKEPLPDLGDHVSLNTPDALSEARFRLACGLLHALLEGPGSCTGQGSRGLSLHPLLLGEQDSDHGGNAAMKQLLA